MKKLFVVILIIVWIISLKLSILAFYLPSNKKHPLRQGRKMTKNLALFVSIGKASFPSMKNFDYVWPI